MKSPPAKILISFAVYTLLWTLALWTRREVFAGQARGIQGAEPPFVMESALQFRMTRMVAETGTLPEVDFDVQVPEGVRMRETYSVGAEWIYTTLARLLPSDWSLASRVRWVATALFSLAIPFAAGWISLQTRSRLSGLLTGLILAVSPAFAVRSSGLELSRENLAIPLFVLFLLGEARLRLAEPSRWRWLGCLCTAAALAAAQCVWDLTQYLTGLWVIWSWWRLLRDPGRDSEDRPLIFCVTLTMLVCAVWNPYLRAHGSLFSPVLSLLLARCLALLPIPTLRRCPALLLVLTATLLCGHLLGRYFVENYSHFGELLTAKLRFLNQKPADPALLTYAQRIMWTPALNSSTWLLTKDYFGATLFIFFLAVGVLGVGIKQGRIRVQPVFFYAAFTLPVYVLFFRFHIFLILFAAGCIGWALVPLRAAAGSLRRRVIPALLLTLYPGVELYLLLFFEPKPTVAPNPAFQHLQRMVEAMGGQAVSTPPSRWGVPTAHYQQLSTLMRELRQLPDPGPVLANFPVSGSILAETGLPILLHPKFETPGIRERVREFYTHLFLEDEKALRDWAVALGARYYVHSNGHLSMRDPRNSPRYMVDALKPPAHAAVHVLEKRPQEAVWFRPLYDNSRYRVYRIIRPEDEEWATRLTRLAFLSLEAGDLEGARRRALQALSYHWKYEPARDVLRAIPNLPHLP